MSRDAWRLWCLGSEWGNFGPDLEDPFHESLRILLHYRQAGLLAMIVFD